jgi:hypothetical protein
MSIADVNAKRLLRSAVETMVGNAEDDLHRVRARFHGLTPSQMQEQHGESGVTRQVILSEYEEHLYDCKGAQHLLDQLLRGKS